MIPKQLTRIETLKNLFSLPIDREANEVPSHIASIQSSTKFSMKEILDFRSKFLKLCSPGTSELNMKNFVTFMRMMGVKSSKNLIKRLYKVIDIDGNQTISFSEFMLYFNILLHGQNVEKAEITFRTIAAGNEDNCNRRLEEVAVNISDLKQMIKTMKEDEHEDQENDQDQIHQMASRIFEQFNVDLDQVLTLKYFRIKIREDESALETFLLMGNGLKSLMAHQGENKYSQIVRVLHMLSSRYKCFYDDYLSLINSIGDNGIIETVNNLKPISETNEMFVKLGSQLKVDMSSNSKISKIPSCENKDPKMIDPQVIEAYRIEDNESPINANFKNKSSNKSKIRVTLIENEKLRNDMKEYFLTPRVSSKDKGSLTSFSKKYPSMLLPQEHSQEEVEDQYQPEVPINGEIDERASKPTPIIEVDSERDVQVLESLEYKQCIDSVNIKVKKKYEHLKAKNSLLLDKYEKQRIAFCDIFSKLKSFKTYLTEAIHTFEEKMRDITQRY